MINNKCVKYIVWDWNGTLLDDVPTCIGVMDGMLKRRGLPALGGAERYREIFTFPVREYYRLAGLDLDREDFGELAVEYINEYNQLALECGLYPGTAQVLAALEGLGYVQLIASASEQGALRQQVEARGISRYFQALLGVGDSLGATKEGVARAWLEGQGLRFTGCAGEKSAVSTEAGAALQDTRPDTRLAHSQVLFIGDTLHDWEVARGMGCSCVLIANGHQSRGRLENTGGDILEDIGEVLEYLEGK